MPTVDFQYQGRTWSAPWAAGQAAPTVEQVRSMINDGTAAPKGTPPPQLDFVGRLKQSLVGPEGSAAQNLMQNPDVRTPGAMGAVLQGAGQALLPGSIPEAAVMGVLPLAGKVAGAAFGGARGVAGGAARAATRLAVPTAAGAAAGAATGGTEGAIQGAKLGLTAGAVGEAFQGTASLVEAAAKQWGNYSGTGFQTRVRNVLGPEMGHRIEADIPSLKGQVNSVGDIMKLTDQNTGGLRRIGKMQDAKEQEIVKTIGTGSPVPVPTSAVDLAATVSGPAAQQAAGGQQTLIGGVTGGSTTNRTAEQTLQLAKVLRQKAQAAPGPDKSVFYDAREQVLDALQQRAGQKLGEEYAAVRSDYRKMVKLNDFLSTQQNELFPAMTSRGGATIDLVKVGDRLVKDFADVSPSDFPALHDMFTGGGTGTRPVGASVKIPIPGVGGQFPTVKVPESMQAQVASSVPGRIGSAGQVAAPLATPAINENVVGP